MIAYVGSEEPTELLLHGLLRPFVCRSSEKLPGFSSSSLLAPPRSKTPMLERAEWVENWVFYSWIAQQVLLSPHITRVCKHNCAESLITPGPMFSLEMVKTIFCKSKQPPHLSNMTEFTVHFALLLFPPLPSSSCPY